MPSLSLATLLDNLPGMAYRCRNDPAWTMEFVSDGCVALSGYQPDDLVGNRALTYSDLIHPDDRGHVWDEVQSTLETGRRYQITYRIQTATGEEKWVWEQGCGITDPGGSVVALEGFIADVTSKVRTNQALEERVAEHNRELTTLLEIAHNVAATLELEPLLGLILDELGRAVEYHGAGVLILEDGVLVQPAARGPSPERITEGIRLPIATAGPIRQIMVEGNPLIIPDVWADDPTARAYRQAAGEEWLLARPYIRSWAGVPLQARGHTLGLLVIAYAEPNYYTERDVRILSAVAAQASVAIENAQLLSAAREAAALEERQRLARDLHDAVTQMLFSASLVGDVLPALWARDPRRGEEALEDLRLLTRGALAEMRTLLFELRPAALVETPLGELLRHLADSVTGRSRLPATVTVQDVQVLPPDVQIAFYRITQEALNNVVKYAGADRVELHLMSTPAGAVELRIHDDGRGFDPENTPVGHFGMQTMRERATAIGATLTVSSRPAGGTDVLVVWPGARDAAEAGSDSEAAR